MVRLFLVLPKFQPIIIYQVAGSYQPSGSYILVQSINLKFKFEQVAGSLSYQVGGSYQPSSSYFLDKRCIMLIIF